MKASIKLPYSEDRMVVGTRHVARLMNLQIVRLTLSGQTLNLTQDIDRTLGIALLSASSDQPVAAASKRSLMPLPVSAH